MKEGGKVVCVVGSESGQEGGWRPGISLPGLLLQAAAHNPCLGL